MRAEQFSNLIIQQLENMAQDRDSRKLILAKRKAISALFPYSISLERGGDQTMTDAFFRVARASCSRTVMWNRILPYATTLFSEPIPPSLNRLITLFSPYLPWDLVPDPEGFVSRWAAAVSETPYTEQVGQSVVDALLEIASFCHLRRHIPMDAWQVLNRGPFLPPYRLGGNRGASGDVYHHIRGLGNTEILKSYLLLVWSEWNLPFSSDHKETLFFIKDDFGQVGTRHHREYLVRRLDYILEELGRGWEHFEQDGTGVLLPREPFLTADSRRIFAQIHIRAARHSYEELREELREEGGATDIVTCLSPNLTRQERTLTFFRSFFTVLSRSFFFWLIEISSFKFFTQQV